MRNRNNITPKNSSQMVLSGRDNILNPKLKTGLIAGNGNVIGNSENVTIIGSSGNIIGDGCHGVTLINSSGCIVPSGITGVTLQNTFDKTVTESNTIYQRGALQQAAVTGNTLTNIYEITVDVPSADVLQLFTTPFELIPAPGAGKYLCIIKSQCSVIFNTTAYTTNQMAIFNYPTGAEPQVKFVSSLLTTPFSTISSGGIYQSATIGTQYVENQGLFLTMYIGNPTLGDSDLRIYITYQIIDI